ncbi:hypothetical protein PUNSTDRAFT_55074 [Punctularia strigosozonata HHB-11173 SS5]|uniref:Uncharacterized protein n=1 Tax=Punctularia strigosozonata (strain HHB-11173) TaxID=741275 RepID=R7S5F1_PUNST|nr:uncharacterized protein PUNSTDRAFT_55074 [Punctularia strigosozonata HHB-11173 SS5]EIN05162.1 hypothetical protein PUNSTDRAFT_55074 [Punctularia strigosozonata HHB-11173 SS5]
MYNGGGREYKPTMSDTGCSGLRPWYVLLSEDEVIHDGLAPSDSRINFSHVYRAVVFEHLRLFEPHHGPEAARELQDLDDG